MNRRHFIALTGASVVALPGCATAGRRLLNASYDATRELYRRLNRLFAETYVDPSGEPTRVVPSHGGSGSQARAVIDGLPADVVTLAMWPDTDALRKKGLIDPKWEDRFPHRSCPYTSTIVLVVRKGNPHGIRDWDDLATKPGLRIVAANPKTSGAAKLGLLAAWGSVIRAGGSPAEAERFVQTVYRRVPALESSSRAATVTFARKLIGDVHITWENEAWLERKELKGELEIIYPKRSIRAEPHVAVVDANARRQGTTDLAVAYLTFLYEPSAQDVIATQYFRPSIPAIATRYADQFPTFEPFQVTDLVAGGWDEAQRTFFADGGVFDRIFDG